MERVLKQKVRKMVECRTDTPAMLEALQAIAAFYGQREGGNTAEARKSLRQDLEKQNMVLCDDFLRLFEVLKERLAALDAHTARLEDHCHGIHVRIETAEESMSAFLAKTRVLQKQQVECESKAVQLQDFLDNFTLSDAEIAALRFEAVENVLPDGHRPFFAALARAQEIRGGCGALVGSSRQNLGFEMLEELSEHQETAFRRLHSYILQRCAGLDRDDPQEEVEENDVALGLGLRTIRDRPALFVHCQECVLQRRKDVVRRRFLQALSGRDEGAEDGDVREGKGKRSMSGSGQRPIDMHSHDPVRYLSDILAWLHQAVASEREFLTNLFRPEAPGGSGGQGERPLPGEGVPTDGQESGTLENHNQELSQAAMLGGIMDGVVALLKARILQLLEPADSYGVTNRESNAHRSQILLLFRLLHLLAFYDVTFQKLGLTADASALGKSMRETLAECQRRFEGRLEAWGSQSLMSVPACPIDLSPAQVMGELGQSLAEIVAVHEASLVPPGALGYALDEVLTALIEPALRACRSGAEGLGPSDVALYMINNAAILSASLTSGSDPPSPAVTAWVGKLREEMETWLGLVVRYESEAVLERTGLGPLLDRAQAVSASSSGTLSATAGLDSESVTRTMEAFYRGLFTLPQFERLQQPALRARARQQTSAIIAQRHEKAHALFRRAESGYPDHETFLAHTPEQVKILLDCDD